MNKTALMALMLLASGCAPRQPFYFFEDGDLSPENLAKIATDLGVTEEEVTSMIDKKLSR